MIRRIIAFALSQPLFCLLVLALFVGVGMYSFRTLPIEAFPDVGDIQVNVVTLYSGRAAEEVEKQVTIPLEVALSGLPHSTRMFSHTQFGLSFIMITFDDAVTDYFARQQVAERLQQADLPQGAQPQLAPLSTPIGEIFRYRLKGDHVDARELRTLEDWVVERQLRMVSGVADVVGMGGFVKQYEVNPSMAKLKHYNVTLQQLSTALGRGNSNIGGSYVEQGEQQYLIRGIGLFRTPQDIGSVVLASHNGTPVRVKDVADVTVDSAPRQGVVGQDGDDDVVTGIVLMRKGENPSTVLAAVKERIAVLNAKILPEGVRIAPFYDRTWLIHTTLTTVFENLCEGALLVAVVLYLFLGQLRAAAIVALLIPLSLLATFIGLKLRGISANLLSLGAMDFGIIVDGGVIVVENVFRALSERTRSNTRRDLRSTILESTSEVGRPTFFAMLIIIAANIPIFALQRHEGRIFAPMAYTVTSALIGSLLFSLTLIPLLCFYLLRGPLPHGENRINRFSRRLYEPLLGRALDRPRLVVGVACFALVGSFALASRLGTEFLPELNEGTLWLNINLLPGISVAEAVRQCRRIREALHTVPEVNTVVSKAGRPEDGTDPKPINMTETYVDLKPASQWRPHVGRDDIIDAMTRALEAIPGVDVSFSQPIRDNVLESISQIDGQIVVKVFGPDPEILDRQTQAVLRAVANVAGVSQATIDRRGSVPQALIEIDREQASRYGLNVGDIQDVIETGLAGKPTSELWEGERHFSVVIRLPEAERALANLENILVDTPDGARIPLAQVTKFQLRSGSMNISREDGQRLMAVSVFIRGRDMGSVVAEMQRNVSGIRMPPGYTVTWGGEFENQQRAMKRLALIVPVSVFIIFVILVNAFGSVPDALLILMNVPFALIGGILALWLTGIVFSVSAAIGFIALFGQAVLNGVVMVSCFNDLRERTADLREAVTNGALIRLRPVLMTAMLAMLGLLPMALSHGIGSETQRPLAVVVIGGLCSATLLTLLMLPVVYLAVARRLREAAVPAASVGKRMKTSIARSS
jgi:heavy metal efflux system protein